jgi:hypothetical protein
MVHATLPAPPLRDHRLDLDNLQRLARTFDRIGDEIGGARYPAVAFVQWLADEYAATGRRPTVGRGAALEPRTPIRTP